MNRSLLLLSAILCLPIASSAGAGPTVERDIPYGAEPDPSRRLDLYSRSPSSGEPMPVVLYVHGGGWFKGDKANVGRKPEWLTGLGFVFVSVNYRLLPAGRHPANAEDVAAAVAWAERRIADHGGDPGRVFLMGHSSGAHLVSLVTTDERYLAAHGLGLDAVAGVIGLDTDCYDVEARIRALPPGERGLYLAAFGGRAATWRDASPIAHVTAGKPLPPFLLLTAGESTSTHSQTETFARALTRVGAKAQTEAFPTETHGSLNQRLGKPRHPATATVESFLRDLPAPSGAGADP